jgi:hypothetical protein
LLPLRKHMLKPGLFEAPWGDNGADRHRTR